MYHLEQYVLNRLYEIWISECVLLTDNCTQIRNKSHKHLSTHVNHRYSYLFTCRHHSQTVGSVASRRLGPIHVLITGLYQGMSGRVTNSLSNAILGGARWSISDLNHTVYRSHWCWHSRWCSRHRVQTCSSKISLILATVGIIDWKLSRNYHNYVTYF